LKFTYANFGKENISTIQRTNKDLIMQQNKEQEQGGG
jgi:hypothetical protein